MPRSRRPAARSPARLGIFGGSFNPIHLAHLRSAEEVREALGLDRIVFVPTRTPPHKAVGALAPARHRLAMVRQAIRGNPRFGVSTVELTRSGGSYSIDTVRALHARYPGSELHLIMGLDQFRELGTWKDHAQLVRLCHLVVTSRPGVTVGDLRRALPVAVRKEFCYGPGTQRLVHTTGTQVIFVRISDLHLSASGIRDRLADGRSIRYLVPQPVERYLAHHRLYRRRGVTLGNQ